MNELYNIWFADLEIKNQTKLDLLENYTVEEIFNLDFTDFAEYGIAEEDIIKTIKSRSLEEARRAFEIMKNQDIKLISIKDKKYPNKLQNIENKPVFIYVRGNENILDDDSVRYGWLQKSFEFW